MNMLWCFVIADYQINHLNNLFSSINTSQVQIDGIIGQL